MSRTIEWLAVEAQGSEAIGTDGGQDWTGVVAKPTEDRISGSLDPHPLTGSGPEVGTPRQASAEGDEQWWRTEDSGEQRQRRMYRGKTVALLRKYMLYSIETGRMPSLLGREFFRSKVTSYTVVTFEDRVIFVHDMEMCLSKLDEFSRQLIARHVLQEHDQAETGRLLQCSERTVRTYFPIVLDLLSDILIEKGLLEAA